MPITRVALAAALGVIGCGGDVSGTNGRLGGVVTGGAGGRTGYTGGRTGSGGVGAGGTLGVGGSRPFGSGGLGYGSGGFGTGGFVGAGGLRTGGSFGSGGASGYTCAPASDSCVACLNSNCCAVMQACRDNFTCWGSGDNLDPGSDGELLAFHLCMSNAYYAQGTVTSNDVVACAAASAVGSVPDNTTQDVIACLADLGPTPGCSVECYNTQL